uniref:Cytochrome c oxidase subunit Vb n=1 Tax=Kalanchoe fedtschenkoi TaxID=63787 RepID=A0A7N0UWL3_KALFE
MMWRRLIASPLQTLRCTSNLARRPTAAAAVADRFLISRPVATRFSRVFSSDAAGNVGTKLRVEDVMPIATGHEREELEAELEGRDILEIDHPVGPFGTKEAPAIVKSYYDKRIVGCPGGEGEDEHDVVWFWLEKDKPHECPVCTQYFKLEVVGPGGSPEGHSDDEHHH